MTPVAPLVHLWGEAEPSALARAREDRLQLGEPVFDFVTANPQEHGFEFPITWLRDVFARAVERARFYRPDPRGQLAARRAVARYHGGVSSDRVVLTPGTSLAYWYCFRLLARPHGDILCPAPSYPLFEDLAQLAGLSVRYYHLQPRSDGHWSLDPEELAFQLTPHTCAIVMVSPNNPTGSVASASELVAVAELAQRRGLAIIFDEVFREFLHTVSEVPRPAAYAPPLTMTLNGVSKMLSLPGVKAAWVVVEGSDEQLVQKFLSALEYASDTFLPVNEYVQAALPELLDQPCFGHVARFAQLYRQRMHNLVQTWQACGVAVPVPEGGIYLPVPLPAADTADEPLALRLLQTHGIYCHPGSWYRLPGAHLVTTCVAAPPWPTQTIADFVASP